MVEADYTYTLLPPFSYSLGALVKKNFDYFEEIKWWNQRKREGGALFIKLISRFPFHMIQTE